MSSVTKSMVVIISLIEIIAFKLKDFKAIGWEDNPKK